MTTRFPENEHCTFEGPGSCTVTTCRFALDPDRGFGTCALVVADISADRRRPGLALSTIGEILGLSRSRIDQIRQNALAKLQRGVLAVESPDVRRGVPLVVSYSRRSADLRSAKVKPTPREPPEDHPVEQPMNDVIAMLEWFKGDRRQTANELGIDPRTLFRYLERSAAGAR
jgi:hypothetical protein